MKQLLFALVVSGAVVSQSWMAAQAPAAQAQGGTRVATTAAQSATVGFPRLSLRGTIENYDPSTRTLSLVTASGTQRLLLASTVRIGRGAQKLEALELGKLFGFRAAVRYSESDGSKTVESVNVLEKSERIVR